MVRTELQADWQKKTILNEARVWENWLSETVHNHNVALLVSLWHYWYWYHCQNMVTFKPIILQGIYPEEVTRQICKLTLQCLDSGLQPWVHGIKLFLNSLRGQVGRVLRVDHSASIFIWVLFENCLCRPGFRVVLRNHTTFSLPFHKTERKRQRHVCYNHSPLNVAHYPKWKRKSLGRQRRTQNAGICSNMWIHLIKAQIFSFHEINW